MQGYKKLLIFSLFSFAVNVAFIVSGGLCLSNQPQCLSWYKKYIENSEKTKGGHHNGLYYIKLNAFTVVQPIKDEKNAIIFAGDSLTDYFEWGEYFGNIGDAVVLNRGVAGETIDGLMERFDITFLSGRNLGRVFLMVGVNDISGKDFQLEDFTRKYWLLLKQLEKYLPRDRICVQSILPVRVKYKSNNTIRKINRKLRTYTRDEGFCYIDLHSKLVNSTGKLDERYSHDGIHLTPPGYKVWLETVKPYVLN